MAKVYPEAYEPNLANTCNNLADLYQGTNHYDEAEKLYIEALEIYRRLAETYPYVYEPKVEDTCSDLARFHHGNRRYDEAEQLYNTALTINIRHETDNPQGI